MTRLGALWLAWRVFRARFVIRVAPSDTLVFVCGPDDVSWASALAPGEWLVVNGHPVPPGAGAGPSGYALWT